MSSRVTESSRCSGGAGWAVAAPIAQAGKPADPLAVSVLLGKGYTPAQIAAMTNVSSPKPIDPLAVSILLGKGYSASRIAAMTGGSIPVGAQTPAVDPLAVSYLRGRGLTPSEIADWTTGACSHEVKAASCFAVFDRGGAIVETTRTASRGATRESERLPRSASSC